MAAPNPVALPPILVDQLALILFFVLSVGYHVYYLVVMRHHPTWSVRARMHQHRIHWVEGVQKRSERIMAVQSLRNLIMTNTFLASTMILLVAFTANYFLIEPQSTADAFAHPNPSLGTGDMPVEVKGIVLVILYAFAFVMFLSSLRTLNHLSILVGVDPEQLAATEGEDAAHFMAKRLNETESMTTYGRRAVYFSIPVFLWLFSPWLFMIFTLIMWFFFVFYMDFVRPFAKPDEAKGGEAGPANHPSGLNVPK